MSVQRKTPAGVIIIAILNLIGAVILLLLSVALILAAFWASSNVEYGDILGPILGVIGIFLLLIAIAFIILSVALLKLRPWARTVMRVLAAIGIAFGILMVLGGDWSSILNLVINIITFFYLGMDHVKEAFSPISTVHHQTRTY